MSYRTFKTRVPASTSGPWRVETFEVSRDDSIMSAFDYGGRAPPAGTYSRLMHHHAVVMSDTPAEWRDHLGLFRQVGPGVNVLVHGLGLGCALNVLLADPSVTVDVVELSQDVIDLVAPHFQPEVDEGRLTITQGDAFLWKPPRGKKWDVVWHDIWNDLCLDNLEQMTKLHRRFGRRTLGYQGSWGKELLLHHKRRQRR